jgi:hypothetical protein
MVMTKIADITATRLIANIIGRSAGFFLQCMLNIIVPRSRLWPSVAMVELRSTSHNAPPASEDLTPGGGRRSRMNVYHDAVDESPYTGDRSPESQNTNSEQQELSTDSSIVLLLERLTNKLDASLLAQETLESRFDMFVINAVTASIGDDRPGRDARPAAAAPPMTTPWHGAVVWSSVYRDIRNFFLI